MNRAIKDWASGIVFWTVAYWRASHRWQKLATPFITVILAADLAWIRIRHPEHFNGPVDIAP